MSPPAGRSWSLTRRLALGFAAVTSLVVACYGLGVGYFVFDQARDSMKDMLADDAEELEVGLRVVADQPERVQRLLEDFAAASNSPPVAFRLRTKDGKVLAEAGPNRLRRAIEDRISPEAKWRDYLFESGIAVHAIELERPKATLEMIASTEEMRERLREYALFALLAFLVAVPLSALAGRLAATRGLRTLRDVVLQAEDIRSPQEAAPIRLEDAPDEVRAVGVALNAMLARIRGELEAMKTFTASLAHELRSPLQNLIGETEVTLLADRPVETYRQLLRSNLEDLHELSDAVDNMVAYCRAREPSVPELHAEEFDLAREAELRLQRERRRAERDGMNLVLESTGDTRLRADREGILRLVRNLVANALDWSPPGGTVRVRLEGGESRIGIVVDDDGPGVDPALGQRVFEPFVSGSAKRGRRGSYGLGLTICKNVVDEHRGSIRHERRPEGGARFVVELPRA